MGWGGGDKVNDTGKKVTKPAVPPTKEEVNERFYFHIHYFLVALILRDQKIASSPSKGRSVLRFAATADLSFVHAS